MSDTKSVVPPDDLKRTLALVHPDDADLAHVAVVGDTYTILLSGADTAGKYSLIDMAVPPCGGPGPHRHEFEEMFHLIEGEIELTFRGEKHVVGAGMTVNIPANAPHFFTNVEGKSARMLCMCAPAGQEDFFKAIGTPVESRTASAPELTDDEQEAFKKKAAMLAPSYRTELLKP
jgi:quercetin dioxygenase-like cupin family protein